MTYNIKALRDLEMRLAEAKGPNFDLECSIAKFIEGDSPRFVPPDYTASLDAAVALVERVLPGAEMTLRMGSKNSEGHPLVATSRLALPFQGSLGLMFRYQPEVSHDDICLALCLACVRALIAQEEARQ